MYEQSPLPGAQSRVDYRTLTKELLIPGVIVHGFSSLHDFNMFESEVCRLLRTGKESRPYGPIPYVAPLSEPIGRSPLADHMRPRGFNGKVTTAYAFVQPPELIRALADPHRQAVVDRSTPLFFTIVAGLHSAARGQSTRMVRDVGYYRGSTDFSGNLGGAMRRLLSKCTYVDAAGKQIGRVNHDGVTAARHRTALLLHQVLQATERN